ncbi:DNA-binding transcriptional regulator, IclR family [Loktanella sp. DSM 29012]|uniref:IclR family transcriptional regulator n=1 Tax=Loktanella sp. DSM 29012 TaxID=1881056 RepID=UPI0008AFA39D|nr:IclR family transcriptional regulator [Loktanella sp. DSM 29012]SEQ01358.1 DNA-binding transcriptional regulator, IclR family [Loktanella sp. DSM 29012]
MTTRRDGTVGKALDVLDQVADFGRPVRFSEVLERADYPKPTLYRLMQTLTHQGMLQFDAERQTYSPGARLVRLAHTAWAQSSLVQVASPHIQKLSAETGETVHLAQIDAGQVLYLDKRNAAEPVPMYSQAGRVGPVYCTGVGKVMLAHLPDDQAQNVISQQSFHRFTPQTITTAAALEQEIRAIRADGFAFDREEHEPGIICVALPVISDNGRVLGAVSVTSTTQRTSLAALQALAPRVCDAAQAIARDAQSWSFPAQTTQEFKLAGE